MKAPLLVEALRTRDPGAPAALYDTHGEGLFRYCWFLLRSRDAAQVALRDTLVLAEAHISQLHDPSLLRPWLYALARAECQRRQESPGATHDSVIARPDQPDADRRLIAWHAVMSLDATEREGLELAIRHDMEPATAGLVLGLADEELQGVLERGRAHLEQALAGEILARHGVHKCAERAATLKGWAGQLTPGLCERLVGHARECEVCRRYLPRNVSAVKVYGLLPVPAPPQSMRLSVMTCFTDPELVGYRMFVAARMADFNQSGFPDEAPAAPAVVPLRRGSVGGGAASRFWTSAPAVAAVAVAIMIAAVFAISRLGGLVTPVQRMSQASAGAQSSAPSAPGSVPPSTGGASGSAPAAGRPDPDGSPSSAPSVGNPQGTAVPTRIYERATPGPSGTPSPSQSTGPTGPPVGSLAVSPSQLSLGPQSTGQVTLTATGAAVTWSAAATSSAITLSSDGGTVTPGSPVTLTVTISRANGQSGSGTIAFTPGGSVAVSWTSPATSPPPPPVTPTPTVVSSSPASSPPPSSTPPTPTPTGTASPTPTPTPTPTTSASPTPTVSPTGG